MTPTAPAFQPSASPVTRVSGSAQRTLRDQVFPSANRISLCDYPLIPVDAILANVDSPPTGRARAASDTLLDYENHDDSDNDVPPQPTGTPAVAGRITGLSMLISSLGPRGREAVSLVQDRQRATKGRLCNMPPRISAPPAVILYEIDGSGDVAFQQDQLSMTSLSAHYLPLVEDSRASRTKKSPSVPRNYTIHPDHKTRIDSQRAGASRARWIPGEVPVELFEAVTQYLSRDDIKSMRLVNREFERGVSRALFNTVVVPFNTELYDMIEQDKSAKRDAKGKGRADGHSNIFMNSKPATLHWKNAMEDKEDKLYRGHGLRVFEGFGSHIRRFGMSFEVKEDALRNPPQKKALDQLDSYFGSYKWPSTEYTRFGELAGLERTADETSQMKLAFSHLHKVQHLALCLDSGLGWISGPDKSMRTQILQRASPIFGGCSHGTFDAQRQQRDSLWDALESTYTAAGRLDELKEGRLQRSDLPGGIRNVQGLSDTRYQDTSSWSTIGASVVDGAVQGNADSETQPSQSATGVLYVQPDDELELFDAVPTSEQAGYGTLRTTDTEVRIKPKQYFTPANLDKHQKEWLLEAEWAQRAFLMSYMLAVVDNAAIFSRVTVLNLARISSRLVPLFYRHDFWNALPALGDITIGVIPDWRTVERDDAGFVETRDIEPSKAHEGPYTLLKDYIGPKSSIKKIKFGWAAGGENAEGCLARNNHILPAPITLLPRTVQSFQDDQAMLHLPHVEHLTLSNCWISPPSLINLVKNLESASLKKMSLESVSLTAHPRFPVVNGVNPNIALANVPLFHPLGRTHPWFNQHNLQAQAQAAGQVAAPQAVQQFGLLYSQGPAVGQHQIGWAQHMLQQMQLMMTGNGIAPHQLSQMWINQPVNMSLDRIAQNLAMIAAGAMGLGGMFFGGNQGNAAAFNALPVAAMMPGANAPAAPNSNQQWYENHRDGSWATVVDALSPGPTFAMYRPRDEFDPVPTKRETGLAELELISCGYVALQNAPFDQTMLETPQGERDRKQHFQRRRVLLEGAMLCSTDRYLGHIIQFIPEREQDALRFAWNMTMGWDDERKAAESEYDGFLPGGTGRFSGIVTKNMDLGAAATHTG